MVGVENTARSDPPWVRAAVAGIILVGVLLQSRSLNVFFHHDDLEILESLASAPDPWRWVVSRHVDHLPVTRNVLYLVFLRAFGPTTAAWHVLLLALLAANAALLAALLRRMRCSPAARIFAVGTFAASTVFHECVYWVACSNFSLALVFSLAALVCLVRAGDDRPRPWRLVAFLCALLALLSSTIAVVLPFLGLVVACALPGTRSARRIASFAAVPAAAIATLALVLALAPLEPVPNRAGSAALQFDAAGGAVLAVRGLVERLAAAYFTGGRLPFAAALFVVLALVVAALLRPREAGAPPPIVSVLAPLAWILASGFAAYAFRTWLGEVVFVSRYQLFPAVAFAWLIALAVDGARHFTSRIGPRWEARATALILGGLLPAVLGMALYAHKVCDERWLFRTQALQQAHEEIARGLRELVSEARREGRPIVLRDYLIGGGTGYRPRLGGMSGYLLTPEERRFLAVIEERAMPLPSSLEPLAAGLREGRRSWLEWLDDLAVSDLLPGEPVPGQPLPLQALWPHAERVVVERLDDRRTRLRPLGQGQVPILKSGSREDVRRWETLSFVVRSEDAGELLVAFTGPSLPELGRGARVFLYPGEERRVLVDVPLATRGARASVDEVELRLVNELTTYEIGEVMVRTASPVEGQ